MLSVSPLQLCIAASPSSRRVVVIFSVVYTLFIRLLFFSTIPSRKTLFPFAVLARLSSHIYSGVFIYLLIFIYLVSSASNRNFIFVYYHLYIKCGCVNTDALTHFVRVKFSLIKINAAAVVLVFNILFSNRIECHTKLLSCIPNSRLA